MGKPIKSVRCNRAGSHFGELDPFMLDGDLHIVNDRGCLSLPPKHAKRLAKQILALLEDVQ